MSSVGVFDISDDKSAIKVSIDLVAAARRHLHFLRTVADSLWLYDDPSLRRAVRRYDKLWMPLISSLTTGKTLPIILPPLDVQWIWHCHTLNPASYRRYCQLKLSKIIEKPVIYDYGNEEYALSRCSDIWCSKYPIEPFELEDICDEEEEEIVANEDIYREVIKHKGLCAKFSEPYMLEIVYLISSKQRYKGFMYLLQRFKDGYSRFVPTLDIQLMWLTHQSYPLRYAEDVKEIEGDLEKLVIGIWDELKEEDVEGSKRAWEQVFDQPYEKAGATIDRFLKPPVYWIVSDVDVNTKYNSMAPRFLLEVCVFLRGKTESLRDKSGNDLLRLRAVRCHRDMKCDKTLASLPSDTWQNTWHLYCEFSTKGLIIELRRRGAGGTNCCSQNKVRGTLLFVWNDLLRAPCLTIGKEIGKEVSAVASITPPAQAPYLLKCVPDRVTDDSGSMISDEILKMNRYRPQEGRWLSRTVLDHAGRDCFVVRIRVGGGIWRRGGENPVVVKWEDRIIEVREGCWSYVAGSIGRIPEKVAGTATPNGQTKEKASWSLSTGDELTLHWVASGLTFDLQNKSSNDSVRLLQGRKLQYQVMDEGCKDKNNDQQKEEEAYVTLVRYTPGNPHGRATALMNWKLVVVELLPEEDAVRVLLICMAILRSVSEMMGEDMGNLLVRRRFKEHKIGMRDWGSIVMHPSSSTIPSAPCSPFLQPWYWNANAVMASGEADHMTRQATPNYPPAEGGDKLYKCAILPKSK